MQCAATDVCNSADTPDSTLLTCGFLQDMDGPLAVATVLKDRLAAFRQIVPVIEALASTAVRDWHWADVSDVLQMTVNPDDGLTLQHLLNLVRTRHCTLRGVMVGVLAD